MTLQLERISPTRSLIYGDPRLLDWCGARIPHVATTQGWHDEGAQALGIVDEHRDVIAVMVVHGYQRAIGAAEISMAATSPRWATRGVIAKLLAYPFGQLDCQRITTVIPAKNRRAIRFNEGLGFQREGLVRRGYGDDDAVVLGLLREEAPWWVAADRSATSGCQGGSVGP